MPHILPQGCPSPILSVPAPRSPQRRYRMLVGASGVVLCSAAFSVKAEARWTASGHELERRGIDMTLDRQDVGPHAKICGAWAPFGAFSLGAFRPSKAPSTAGPSGARPRPRPNAPAGASAPVALVRAEPSGALIPPKHLAVLADAQGAAAFVVACYDELARLNIEPMEAAADLPAPLQILRLWAVDKETLADRPLLKMETKAPFEAELEESGFGHVRAARALIVSLETTDAPDCARRGPILYSGQCLHLIHPVREWRGCCSP